MSKGFLGISAKLFLKKRKDHRNSIIIIGITILLYSAILFSIDSVSPVLDHYAHVRGGNQDIVLQKKNMSPDSSMNLFNYQTVSGQLDFEVAEIKHCVPRLYLDSYISRKWYRTLGIDFSTEYFLQIGLEKLISNITSPFSGLSSNECIVSQEIFQKRNLSMADKIQIHFDGFNITQNFSIVGVYDPFDNYPYSEDWIPAILIDLHSFWLNFPEYNQKINSLSIILNPNSELYQLEDYEGSQTAIIQIGNKILTPLGYSSWDLHYPNMKYFDTADITHLIMSAISIFTKILVTFLCIILIYNCVSTSLANRIREMGIFSALGAKKRDLFLQLIMEGVIIGGVATILGLIGAIFASRVLIVPIINNVMISRYEVGFKLVISFQKILDVLSLGFLTSIIISIFPSMQIFRWSVVDTINPDNRLENPDYSSNNEMNSIIKKNKQFFLFSSTIFLLGVYFFDIITKMYTSASIYSFLKNIVIILCVSMVGLVIISYVIIKYTIPVLISIMSAITHKSSELLKLGINKHRRKNQIISIMLILSFSIMSFMFSYIGLMGDQITSRTQLNFGSDISIHAEDGRNLQITQEHINSLREIEGVESISGMINSLDMLEDYYNFPSRQESMEFGFSVSRSDLFEKISAKIYGIDKNYLSVIFQDQIQMEEGDFIEDISQLFDNSSINIFISSDLSNNLNLNQFDNLNLEFRRNDEIKVIEARIIGIFNTLPGISYSDDPFGSSIFDEILISHENLNHFFSLPQHNHQYHTRLFIKLHSNASPNQMLTEILECFDGYSWAVNYDLYKEQIDNDGLLIVLAKIIVYLCGAAVILMAIFGFVSSSYSVFIERRNEIKIYRAIGLSVLSIKSYFTLELSFLLFLNGIVGTIIGFISSITFSTMSMLFFGANVPIKLPVIQMILIFILCWASLKLQFRRMFNSQIKRAVFSTIKSDRD